MLMNEAFNNHSGRKMTGKEYIRTKPASWWLAKRSYTLFMLRELTAVFVAGYAIVLLVLIWRATQGETAFTNAIISLGSPVSIVLHVLAFIMVVYHTITFFNLSGRVMVVWRGEEKVNPVLIVGPNYAAWIVVSAIIAWVATRGA